MFSVAICDDDVRFLKYITEYLTEKYRGEIRFTTFSDCSELLEYVQFHGMLYDGIIMDICYDSGDGIETIQKLYEISEHVCVAYVTGYAEHMERIFDTRPCYFLRKPLNLQSLDKAVEKMKREMKKQCEKRIVLKIGVGKEIGICSDDIIYMESKAHKAIIHTKQRDYEINEKLDNLQSKLDGTFIRTHKSYLINMRYVEEKRAYEILLSTGETVAISKMKRKEVKEKISAYLGNALWG